MVVLKFARAMGLTKRRRVLLIVVIAVAAVAIAASAAPSYIESRFNRVLRRPPYAVSEEASKLHQSLTIADLHADTLLWGRDLLQRSGRGHVDLPRLQQANVAIQAFTVVTKAPRNLNIERNAADSDVVTYLALAEHWPAATWNSLLQRALYQARRLREAAQDSKSELVVIRTAADVDNLLAARQRSSPPPVGALLGLEGAQALEGKLENLDVLYDAGFRMVSPTHFFDTEIAGAAAGVDKGGLTPLGREFVRRMEAKRMLIDLAHASAATVSDVTAMARRPVLVSHTGVKATCNNNRNLSDREMRAVAATGGVIGIGYWSTAVCGKDARAVARAIRYTSNLVGVEHVALGSDFDGATTEPFDVTGTALITEALQEQGFSADQIRLIMGGNVVRLLRETLP